MGNWVIDNYLTAFSLPRAAWNELTGRSASHSQVMGENTAQA